MDTSGTSLGLVGIIVGALLIAAGTLFLWALNDKNKQIDIAEDRTKAAETRTAAVEGERDESREKYSELWDKYTAEREDQLQVGREHAAAIGALESQVRALTTRIEHQDSTIAAQSQEIARLTAQVEGIGGGHE